MTTMEMIFYERSSRNLSNGSSKNGMLIVCNSNVRECDFDVIYRLNIKYIRILFFLAHLQKHQSIVKTKSNEIM